MKHNARESARTMFMGACLVMLAFGGTTPAFSKEPNQSTGTGTIQGEDGSMATKRGGNTGPTTGRNEHSGAGTGARAGSCEIGTQT
ncbi:MAG TPA: hypothetical protein VFG71_07090 [Nitrospiraceae bacterium]|nr:hypothetical protein [Nitrospiraceae bacterium]